MPVGSTATACVHHWVYPTPNGPTAVGTCRKCGQQTAPHKNGHDFHWTWDDFSINPQHRNGSKNRRKTHCPQGHAYEGHNVIVWRGRRNCRTCLNARRRSRRAGRGDSPTCRYGHPYGDNPKRRSNGSRICPTCRAAQKQREYAQRRNAA